MNSQLYHAADTIAARGSTDGPWREQLYAWAVEPPSDRLLARVLRRGLWLVTMLLISAGMIFWLAANWQEMTRGLKLALIESFLVATLVLACWRPRARTGALLAATLALGGLLAFIGQTYQTGADAWQLFAAWAVLSALWVLTARSDLLWTVWVLIAALALALWTGPLGLWGRVFSASSMSPVMTSLSMLLWLVLGFLPVVVAQLRWVRLPAGWGGWSHRVAFGAALASWTSLGVLGVFVIPGFSIDWPLAMVLVMVVGWISRCGPWRDLPTLALAVVAANVLVMAGATRMIFNGFSDLGAFFMLGLLGLGCLGGSATWLLRQQQAWKPRGQA